MARRPAALDDDPAPWRDRAERAPPRHTVVTWRALIIGASVALLVSLCAVLGVRWLIARDEARLASGAVELIRAPAEPYKSRPADAGGAGPEPLDQTIYAAGEGADPIGEIAAGALPEELAPTDLTQQTRALEPVAITPPPPPVGVAAGEPGRPAPGAKPAVAVAAVKAPPEPKPEAARPASVQAQAAATPAPGTAAVQLGAFSSRAKADAAWKGLSARFAYLAPLTKEVATTEAGGQTLHRLRAGGLSRPAAADVCARLKVAGESCLVAP